VNLPSWLRRLLDALAGRRTPRPPDRPPGPPPPPQAPGDGVAAHNEARARHGLPPYLRDDKLRAAAAEQAAECARVGKVTHTGRDGSDPWMRINRHGYPGGKTGENAYGAQWPATATDAVDAWMASSVGHRANVLGDYRHCGMAHADAADGDRFWIACYGRP
jgi:uncharacterized protein YkwD